MIALSFWPVAAAAAALLVAPTPAAAAQNGRGAPAVILRDVTGTLSDGGKVPPIPRNMVRAVDVNRDGTADWLIDYAKAGETAWCGSGGCRYQLFVSTGSDSFALAFDEIAHSLRIRPDGRVEVDVYGTYCGSFGADECRRSFVWSAADAMLMPVVAAGQGSWLFGPLFSPVVTDRKAWPAAIASAVARRSAACDAAGGTLDEADGAIVRSPDLDGDGRADWIIGSPFSACVSKAIGADGIAPDLARPTLVVISGAPVDAIELFAGSDANYVVDITTSPATLLIVPDDEERLQRCAGQPSRCGGTALHYDRTSKRLIDRTGH